MQLFLFFPSSGFPPLFRLAKRERAIGIFFNENREVWKNRDTFSHFVGLDPAFARSNEARRRALYYAVLIALTG